MLIPYNKKNQGLSLIELIITIMIAGILLSMAIPSFSTMIKNAKLNSEVKRIIEDIKLARGTATKEGWPVTLCRTNYTSGKHYTFNKKPTPLDALKCGGGSEWTDGWLVIANHVDGTDETLYIRDKLKKVSQPYSGGGLSITANTAAEEFVKFTSSATTKDSTTYSFKVCDDRGASFGKLIEIPPIGRPRLIETITSCSF